MGQEILVDGVDVVPLVHAVLDKMADFSNRVRSRVGKGYKVRALEDRNQEKTISWRRA